MLNALIMAGGKGVRLYPLSRKDNPKQFLNLINGKSLLRNTFERIIPEIPRENLYVVTNKDYLERIFREIPEVDKNNIFTEPCNKETATCIALSTIKLYKNDKDATLIVLPSDHYIEDENTFRKEIRLAASFAKENRGIITFGIVPSCPETGYGYIEREIGEKAPFKIKRFTEKPNLEVAKDFLIKKNYLWNSGIFVFRADVYLHEMEKYLPKMYKSIMKIYESIDTPEEKKVIEEEYNEIDGISIDYGIMQKTCRAFVYEASFDWSDIGSFAALSKFISGTGDNRTLGNAFLEESTNCSVFAGEKLIIGFGIKDIMVVDAGDVILIMDKSKDQEIKFLVNKLQEVKDTSRYV